MCKFCTTKGTREVLKTFEFTRFDLEVYVEDDNTLALNSFNCDPESPTDFSESIEIKYCPMCGRDLNEEIISFSWEGFKEGKFAINCTTRKNAENFIAACYEQKLVWEYVADKKKSYWGVYEQYTCYSFWKGYLVYGDVQHYRDTEKLPILEWEEE